MVSLHIDRIALFRKNAGFWCAVANSCGGKTWSQKHSKDWNCAIIASKCILPYHAGSYGKELTHSANHWLSSPTWICMFCCKVSKHSDDYRKDFWMQALMITLWLHLRTTGNICAKSPLKIKGMPPKRDQSSEHILYNIRCMASKQYLCCIGTSSQMTNATPCKRSASWEFLLILHVESSCTSIGILNRECDVQPPGSRSAAMLEDVMQRTILPNAR